MLRRCRRFFEMPPSREPPEVQSVISIEVVLHDRPRRPVFAIRSRDLSSLTVFQIKRSLHRNLAVFSVNASNIELRTSESGHLLEDNTTIADLLSAPPLFRPQQHESSKRSAVNSEPWPEDRVIVLRALERDAAVAVAVLVDQQQMVFIDGQKGSSLLQHAAVRLQRLLGLLVAPKLFDAAGHDELDPLLELNMLRCRYRKDDTVVASAADPSYGSVQQPLIFMSTIHVACKLRDATDKRQAQQQPSSLFASLPRRESSPMPRTPSRSVLAAVDSVPQLVQVFKTFDDWEKPVSISHSLVDPTAARSGQTSHEQDEVVKGCATEPRQVAHPLVAQPLVTTQQNAAPESLAQRKQRLVEAPRIPDASGVEAPSWSDFPAHGTRPSNVTSIASYSSVSGQEDNCSGTDGLHSSIPRKLWGKIIHTVQPVDTHRSSNAASRFVNPATLLAPDMRLRESERPQQPPHGRSSNASLAPDNRSSSNASTALTEYRVGGTSALYPTAASDGNHLPQRTVIFDDIFVVGTPQGNPPRRHIQ